MNNANSVHGAGLEIFLLHLREPPGDALGLSRREPLLCRDNVRPGRGQASHDSGIRRGSRRGMAAGPSTHSRGVRVGFMESTLGPRARRVCGPANTAAWWTPPTCRSTSRARSCSRAATSRQSAALKGRATCKGARQGWVNSSHPPLGRRHRLDRITTPHSLQRFQGGQPGHTAGVPRMGSAWSQRGFLEDRLKSGWARRALNASAVVVNTSSACPILIARVAWPAGRNTPARHS